jgi:glycosyltransferase involved in cell wall biosynthesis
MSDGVREGRVLMVVHSTVPDDPRVMSEARAARDAGFEVDIVALRGEAETPEEQLEERIRAIRLPVAHVRGAGFLAVVREYLSFTARATLRAARLARARRYRVVQVHNPPDFLAVAALFPKLRRARVVFDVHDLGPDMFHSRYGARRGARGVDRVLRFVERRAIALADEVITVHEPYRRELIARGAEPDRVTVVMNSVGEDLLPRSGSPGEDGRFRVVYHGTITPHYGVELLVRGVALARERVPDIELEVFGSGDARDTALRIAEDLGIADRARFADTLGRREVLAAVQGASVGVVPNLPTRINRFALSTKLFEYVALGIPAVVADLPTLRLHFADSEVLFFRAGDAASLAEALAEVAGNPEAAAARALAAQRRAEAYAWERSAERYIEVLRRGRSTTRSSGRASRAADPG